MGYHVVHRAAVDDDVRRIMSEQAEKALTDLGAVDDDPAEAVHECRKRCKKIRGAVRLVRPAAGDHYSTINELARDAARELASHRDATAMSETFDRLAERWSETGRGDGAMAAVGGVLTARRNALESAAAADRAALDRGKALLSDLGDAIDDLELDEAGYDAIGPGLAEAYDRGREALAAATGCPTGDRFHEWRKRAKYTRYHLELLTPSAPVILEPLAAAFHDLTDSLGDAHDLVVLGEWLRSGADELEPLGDTTEVRVVIDGARSELERRAVALGERLYAESTKRFAKRIRSYWDTWQGEATRSPAGELELAPG